MKIAARKISLSIFEARNLLRWFALFIFTLSLLMPAGAGAEGNPVESAKSHWSFFAGGATTHPGLGDTRTRVNTIDLMTQYGYLLTATAGKGWLRGRHEILFELPVRFVTDQDQDLMASVAVLASWNFTSLEKFVPYVFAGGGLVYTDLDIPELGRNLNGTYQGGFGIRYFIGYKKSLEFSYRYHHISNADTAEPNGPLNSSMVMVGISYW